MRSRSLSTKLIFVFLFLAVAAYFSVQAYRYFVDPQTTTLVYAYSSEDAIAATGYFARDAESLSCITCRRSFILSRISSFSDSFS